MRLIFGFLDQHLGDIMDFIETDRLKISVKDNRIISAMMQINDDSPLYVKNYDMVYSYASEKNYIRVTKILRDWVLSKNINLEHFNEDDEQAFIFEMS